MTAARMRGLRAGVVLLFLLALACGNSDPEKVSKSARSWQATLHLVASHHEVSRTYVKQVVDVAEEELSKLPQDNADVKAALDTAHKMR